MVDITYSSFTFHYEKPNVDRSRLQIHSNVASQQSLFRWIAQDMYIRAPNAEVEWQICTLKRWVRHIGHRSGRLSSGTAGTGGKGRS